MRLPSWLTRPLNLQAKLTLWYVLLVVVLVGSISGVDLVNNMQLRFEATLEQAETVKIRCRQVRHQVPQLASALTPLAKALEDPVLANDLSDLLRSKAILEIAVTDPQTNEILADSNPDRVGLVAQPYPDFSALVKFAPWYEKWKVLRRKRPQILPARVPAGRSSRPHAGFRAGKRGAGAHQKRYQPVH